MEYIVHKKLEERSINQSRCLSLLILLEQKWVYTRAAAIAHENSLIRINRYSNLVNILTLFLASSGALVAFLQKTIISQNSTVITFLAIISILTGLSKAAEQIIYKSSDHSSSHTEAIRIFR
jgi:hypothetical protein